MANWKINCMEDSYPGLWHTWFREQIVAVGWPPPEFGLRTPKEKRDWSLARRYLMQMSPGDKVVVQLKNWRVGRIGTVLDKQIEAAQIDPVIAQIDLSIEAVKRFGSALASAHAEQANEFTKLQQVHQVADELLNNPLINSDPTGTECVWDDELRLGWRLRDGRGCG